MFPECTSPTARADLDHTIEWACDGTTEAGNLASLCAKHHALKSLGHWTVEQVRDEGRASGVLTALLAGRDSADALDDRVTVAEGTGFMTWTSPTGRTYTTASAEYAHGPEDELLADALDLPPDPAAGVHGAGDHRDQIPEPIPPNWIHEDLLAPWSGSPIGPPIGEASEPSPWLMAAWEHVEALAYARSAEGGDPDVAPPPF
ncbi:HNH endonuclease [Sinomonas notoginsengisoli]|uniref:HNH endonuclease n=1 Tax=Sinomonas notoginsengisoli TaxID=1457311 RepID=UPI001F3CCF9A|nr:HNH endonuclease signature motif containing protein [Sinomonas notoginsengisoli]